MRDRQRSGRLRHLSLATGPWREADSPPSGPTQIWRCAALSHWPTRVQAHVPSLLRLPEPGREPGPLVLPQRGSRARRRSDARRAAMPRSACQREGCADDEAGSDVPHDVAQPDRVARYVLVHEKPSEGQAGRQDGGPQRRPARARYPDRGGDGENDQNLKHQASVPRKRADRGGREPKWIPADFWFA